VFNKYSDKRYKRASAFVEAEIQRGFQLPGLQTPKEIMAPPVRSQYENLSYLGWVE
jgi:G2/mitotic-specific cyclin 3/4